jgi:putative ABC transport system ATP-binding protein
MSLPQPPSMPNPPLLAAPLAAPQPRQPSPGQPLAAPSSSPGQPLAAPSPSPGQPLASPSPSPETRRVPAAGAIEASKIYGAGDSEVRALDNVTIAFEAARFSAIMGPSGSGKSTLMHCLAGLDALTSGAVYIGDTYLATLNDKKLTEFRRTEVGFIFQAYNLIPTLNALENITLPLLLGGNSGDQAWIDTVINTVGLRDRLTHRPSELSGGQQQRVAVARALASKPRIIFADEPTGNLDSRAGAEILDFMRRAVNEFGQTIVMVTHDPVAASYADRVVFLGDGKIVDEMMQPTAERVLDRLKRLGG